MPGPKPLDLLRDAIDAARAALDEMEADEVPARLRRVRGMAGSRTLPPPIAASLIRELAADPHLRSLALDQWTGDRPPAGGAALVSFAFLDRGEGWEQTVLEESLAAGERAAGAADRSWELERDALLAEVASLKEQIKRGRAETEARVADLEAALEAERAPGRAERRSDARLAEQLAEARAEATERAAALADRIAAQEAEIKRLKEVAREERAARSALSAALESGDRSALPTDPSALARLLDDITAHATAMAPSPTPGGAGPAPATGFPPLEASIRPDQAAAIDWVVGAGIGTVFVDGYNLGFALVGLDPPRARAVALEAVGRLATAMPDGDVIVVFDGSLDPADGEGPREARSGGAVVLYTSGETADDVIVDRAGGVPRPVVITNDRDLRQRAEAAGATGLWSDALVEWSRRR